MYETFKDDAWIVRNSIIAPEKLHALGVMTFRWNVAEASLKVLLINIAQVEFAVIWAIIHNLGNESISESITELLKRANLPEPVTKAIEHGLKLFDANRINRNQLTHFIPTALVGSDFARLKGPSFDPQPLPDDISDLRRVGDDIGRLQTYMGKLLAIVSSRQYSLKPGGVLPPLPDIIPLPDRLWKPPPPNPGERSGEPDKDSAERPPSVLRLTEEDWIAKYRKEGRPLPDNSAPE
jgi:hypothetical protein